MSHLDVPEKYKPRMDQALQVAEAEAKEKTPEKEELGNAIDRALGYAKKAEGFAAHIEKLSPHVKNAAAWLGKNWYKLLGVVGLSA